MKIWVIGRHYPVPSNKMRGSFELEQAKILAKAGHQVSYIAVIFHHKNKIRNWGFATWEEDGVTIFSYSQVFFPERFHVKLNSFREKVLRKALDRMADENGLPDLIHIHYPTMLGCADVLADFQKKGVRLVCTEHWTKVLSKKITPDELSQLKKYVAAADAFICVGNPLKAAIIDQTDTSKPIHVIPNVFETIFTPSKEAHSSEVYTFICAGRLVKVKQYDKTIQAFSVLSKRYDHIRLSILGDGNEKENLKKLVRELQLEDKVYLHGAQSRERVAEMIQQADCLICYSSLETFGVPIIEAWACGIPAISSDCLGFAEYWQERLGFIVDHKNEDELVRRMEDVMHQTYDKAWISQYAWDHFSEEAVTKQLETVYQSLF